MEDGNDFDIDPAIAEAMGFSGFGMQPGKKRKFNSHDAFLDTAARESENQSLEGGVTSANHGKQTLVSSTGSNATPLGRSQAASNEGGVDQKNGPFVATEATQATGTATPLGTFSNDEEKLRALAQGVRNEDGDMVYFLPSFIEDPWKHLKPCDNFGLYKRRCTHLFGSDLRTPRQSEQYWCMRDTHRTKMPQKTFPEARAYLETLLGYTFRNENLLREALQGDGVAIVEGRLLLEANKLLAMVGDAAMDLVVTHNAHIVGLQRVKVSWQIRAVACNRNLDVVGRVNGIEDCIVQRSGMLPVGPSMMATTVEAILGAMFSDSNEDLQVVRRGMTALGLFDDAATTPMLAMMPGVQRAI